MKTIFIFLATVAVFVLRVNSTTAQTNIFPSTGAAGIGTTSPAASSLLEVKSVKKGVLIPRMTKAQRDSIASPATGLLIYQTDKTPGFYYYSGAAWTAISAKGANTTLSNLKTPTAVSQSLLPGTNNALDLGSSALAWRNGYFEGNVGIGISNPSYKLDVSGDINQSAGSVIRIGGALAFKCDNPSENIWAGGGGVSNTSGYYNTAFGILALGENSTGYKNTAIGLQSLITNSTGIENTATGYSALGNNNGNHNTADGFYGLFHTTNSDYNTALGYTAGDSYDNGYNNVFLGANTDVNGAGYYNVIAIGQGTTCTASSQVTMGNSSTTSYRAYADWSNISDGRVKKNIKNNVPGLVFINKLIPITYSLDLDAIDKIIQPPVRNDSDGKTLQPSQQELKAREEKEQIIYTGFVAQDVEKAATELNYNFSGVDAAKNNKDLYGLRYADFVVPLVKAVQELSQQNDDLKSENDALKLRLDKLEAVVLNNQNPSTATAITNASLEQNVPNPFTHNTTISYTLPQKFNTAQIMITDKSGKSLKLVNLPAGRQGVSGGGKGIINVDASVLAAGAYNYSLLVDGKLIGTKQMVLTK